MSSKNNLILTCLIALIPALAQAQTTHTVTQLGTSFSPSAITIEAGDTVRWEWTSGLHTVTNGTGASDRSAGSLFDASLTSATPSFEFTFVDAGEVPFFCRPHEALNMTGTISVEEATDAPAAKERDLYVRGVEPNPFNPRTSLRFSLAGDGEVDVHVHDARGRLVRRIATGVHMEAGAHSLQWDGRDDGGREVASGVYRFVVRAAGLQQSVSGVLVR